MIAGAPPLGELLDLLASEGFAIGVDDHLRVARLLARDASWTEDTLRIALRSILAKDLRERAAFDVCWARLFATVGRPEIEPPDEEAATPPPRRIPYAAIVAGALLLITAIAIVLWRRPGAPEVARSSAPDAAPQRPLDARPADAGDSGPIEPELEPEVTVVPAAPDAGPGPAVGRVDAQPTPPPSPPDHGGWLLVALLAGGVLAAGTAATIAARLARRRGTFVPGPWQYRRRIPESNAPVLVRQDVEDGAADLTWRPSEEGGAELDLDRTVHRTVAAGGRPVLVYRPPPPAPEYLVLEDVSGGAERWRFLYDELLRGLVREGVRLQRYTFTGSPEVCVTADGRSEVALRDLAEHGDALVVIGDGAAGLDPLTGQTAEWVQTLRHVPRRLWVNPLPPSRWTEAARAIGQQTPMEHGAAHALAALHAGVDRTDPEHAYPAVIDRAPASTEAVSALRAHLGDPGFRVLSLMASAGEPSVAAARWLAGRFAVALDEAAWLRLVTLPWLDDRRWPAGLRERLAAGLTAEAPELAAAADEVAAELIAVSEPVAGSAAHLRWQLDRAQVAAGRGDRDAAVASLSQLAASPVHAEAVRDLAGLGVGDRRRTAITTLAAAAVLLLVGGGALGVSRALRSDADPVASAATDAGELVVITGDAGPAGTLGVRLVGATPGIRHAGFCGDAGAVLLVDADDAYSLWDPVGYPVGLGAIGDRVLCNSRRQVVSVLGTELQVRNSAGELIASAGVDAAARIAVSPDGRSVVASTTVDGQGRGLHVLEIDTGATYTLLPDVGDTAELRFDRNGGSLAHLAADGRVTTWRIARVDDQLQLDPATAGIATGVPVPSVVAASTESRWMAAEADGGNTVIVDWPSGDTRLILGLAGVQALAATADGAVIVAATASDARFVRVADGATIASVAAAGPALSPDGRRVVGVIDGEVRVWELETSDRETVPVASFDGGVVVAAASGGGVSTGRVGRTTVRSTATPTIVIGEATRTGDLDKSIIRRYLKRYNAKIQYCYNRERTNDPTLAGTVIAKFTIAQSGKVLSSTASGMNNPVVEQCIADVIASIEFPSPVGGGIVTATWPFEFKPPAPEVDPEVVGDRDRCDEVTCAVDPDLPCCKGGKTPAPDPTKIAWAHVEKHSAALLRCYDEDDDKTLSNTVTLTFRVSSNGSVFSADARGIGSDPVEHCMIKVLDALRVPSWSYDEIEVSAKLRLAASTPAPAPDADPDEGGDSLPETLDSSMVKDAVSKVKARILACFDSAKVEGKLVLSVKVSPAGAVTDVAVVSTPDAGGGACASAAMRKATFARTRNGASFKYPFSVGSSP